MTKRSRVILAVVTLAALAGIAWSILKPGPPDPIYSGHRLSYWVLGPDPKENWSPPPPPDLDSNAVPYLVECLKARDGRLQKAYINVYRHLPWWVWNRLPYPRFAATRGFVATKFLASMGSTARPAIPELVHLANTGDEASMRNNAIYALMNIATRDDTAAVEFLKAAAQEKNPPIRELARTALEKIDPKAAATIREKAAIDALSH